jgi:hypothetical protein
MVKSSQKIKKKKNKKKNSINNNLNLKKNYGFSNNRKNLKFSISGYQSYNYRNNHNCRFKYNDKNNKNIRSRDINLRSYLILHRYINKLKRKKKINKKKRNNFYFSLRYSFSKFYFYKNIFKLNKFKKIIPLKNNEKYKESNFSTLNKLQSIKDHDNVNIDINSKKI